MSITRNRDEIAEKYKWKLEDIYKDEASWEEDFKKVQEGLPEIEQFKNRLQESAGILYQALQKLEELQRRTEKLYVYARMRRDENNTNTSYQTLFERIEWLSVQVSSSISFIIPEITAIAPDIIDNFMQQEAKLQVYRHFLDELWRQKKHILSPDEERILAMSADLATAAGSFFNMFNNADIKFPTIIDEEDRVVEITKGSYGRYMESSNRRVRQEAFKALYNSYGKFKNTLASCLAAGVKKDIFYSRVRKYSNSLEAALDQDNISTNVYEQLIISVHNKLDYMYRYMKLRKEILGLAELHMYDIYVPLVSEYRVKIPYEKACQKVLAGLQPLGQEYNNLLKKAMHSGWIDVYENQGKTSGAYSWGTFDTNPYVLMNYDNKLDDVFTLAHELGHSLHSYYSNHNQPFIYSQYPIFLAEVASTVNESLLIDYLLQNSNDKQEKMYLINHYLEQFRGTVYRQTMFAEFEKIIHGQVEQGGALTTDELCRVYHDLNSLYYGPDVVMDKEIEWEWSRIPHFYSAFYVYKYATGFSAATVIKENILKEGQPAVDRYLDFLKSGGSDYPLNLLKKVGVDLTTPQPVNQALEYFRYLLDELEQII
ncbi:MAG: oligoendopeptidase F [Syntrophomonadaceae bacterium]